jgi:hypothetical protein
MLITKNSLSSKSRGLCRLVLLSFLTLNMVVWSVSVQGVLADTPEKTNEGSSDNSKPAAATQAPPTKEEALMVSLKRMNNLNTLIEGGKDKEALPLAKSMISDVDKYIIAMFNQPKAIESMPPDVVAAIKKNDAEPLCQLLDKELAEDSKGLENIKALMSIRSKLKAIIASLTKGN